MTIHDFIEQLRMIELEHGPKTPVIGNATLDSCGYAGRSHLLAPSTQIEVVRVKEDRSTGAPLLIPMSLGETSPDLYPLIVERTPGTSLAVRIS